MRTDEFDYDLPQELIAQSPAPIRDQCRLLVLDRKAGQIADRVFADVVQYLRPGDLLVANETRVLPGRLLGQKRNTGGQVEILLLDEVEGSASEVDGLKHANWNALVKPGKRLKPGTDAVVDFACTDGTSPLFGKTVLSAEIVGWGMGAQKGEREVRLTTELDSIDEALHAVGHTPLPPYIHDYVGDDEMYQTVFSTRESSAAAPTAGLHFTPELIEKVKEMGVHWATVELEVGLDTFRIVDEEEIEDHQIHTERYSVPPQTAQAVAECKSRGGRVIAVGTTSVRSLESAAAKALAESISTDGVPIVPVNREATSLYITPGYDFRIIDGMITNFHVPRSTLMMLVSAFAGRDNIMRAYEHAKSEHYRFLSFGDAMLIV